MRAIQGTTLRPYFNNVSFAIAIFMTALFFGSSASAMRMCLHARTDGGLTSGHAFVTVESNKGEIIESYGFWPASVHPKSAIINYPTDMPLWYIDKTRGLSPRLEKMSEARICQSLVRYSIPQIRSMVLNYTKSHGKYKVLSNNCTHFAVNLYNFATKDTFPQSLRPADVISAIKRVHKNSATSYQEYRERRN